MQYDNPFWTSEFKDAITANPGISDTTADAISTLLDLDNKESIVVGSWDGVATDALVPTGKTADAAFIDIAGTAPVVLDLPDNIANTKAIVIASDADVTLEIGVPAPSVTPTLMAFAEVSTDRVVVGGNGNDTITVLGSGNTTLEGGDGNDTLTTGSGNDVIIGGNGNNQINAGAGNDTIIVGTGNDTIDAGEGRDVVKFTGDRADYTVTSSNGTVEFTHAGQTVTVSNAEFFKFDTGSLAVVETEAQASALRLYQGLLGRDADNAGAEGFSSAVANGATLKDTAAAFLGSAEYQNALNDSFVDHLYTDLLGRGSDAQGVTDWLAALANGASRADVAAAFSASAEAQAGTQSNADFVDALYQNALGRGAEQSGLDSWVAALTDGASRDQVASAIFGSSEAASKTNSDFIDALYTNALGRDANLDAVGKAGWMAALEHGATQAEVTIGIVGSTEAQDHISNVVVVHGAV